MCIVKWLYNWLSTESNDYTIDYIHRQMIIQLTMYISNDYTIDYVHRQMTIQLTIPVAKWLYNRQYT